MQLNLREKLYKLIQYEPIDSSNYLISKEIISRLNSRLPLTSVEISSTTFCSKATITRFAQNFGFKGFKDFARSIEQQEIEKAPKMHVKNYNQSFKDYNELLKKFIIDVERQNGQLGKIVEEIKQGQKVYIFCSYENMQVAKSFADKLSILEIQVVFIFNEQVMLLNSITNKDFCLFLVSGTDNRTIKKIWKYLRDKSTLAIIATQLKFLTFANYEYGVDINLEGELLLHYQLKKFLFSYILDQIYNLLVHSEPKYFHKVMKDKLLNLN